MAHIILVHGMSANKNSWFEVKPFLESKGHTVSARTLPGHGNGFRKLADKDASMEDYIDEVRKDFPTNGDKVILIGHSMGGQVITQIAAKIPKQIEKLVYVAAMLPQKGDSAKAIINKSGLRLWQFLVQLFPYVVLYSDAFASQPRKPLKSKLVLPDASDGDKLNAFNSLKRYYVWCKKDKILPFKYQKTMIDAAGLPSGRVVSIETDHIPQKSSANKLHPILAGFIDE